MNAYIQQYIIFIQNTKYYHKSAEFQIGGSKTMRLLAELAMDCNANYLIYPQPLLKTRGKNFRNGLSQRGTFPCNNKARLTVKNLTQFANDIDPISKENL